MIIAMKRFTLFVLSLVLLSTALFSSTETFLNKKEKAYIDAKPVLNVYVAVIAHPNFAFYFEQYNTANNGFQVDQE